MPERDDIERHDLLMEIQRLINWAEDLQDLREHLTTGQISPSEAKKLLSELTAELVRMD